MRPARHIGALLAALILAAEAGAVGAASVEFVREYKLDGDFAGKKKQTHAIDVSGFACTTVTARHCLAINDENRNAQFATVEDGTIRVGKKIKLISKKPESVTFGKPPEVKKCSSGKGDFEEFDGEGVAYSAPYFYVVGSHGCGRNNKEFKASSFVLARIRVDERGRPVDEQGDVLSDDEADDAVETTYRLSDHLRRAARVKDYFGRDLDDKTKGLNIEGIAVIGPDLYVGLRAPSLDRKAFIIKVSSADLFRRGDKSFDANVIPLALGEDVGIRDLAALPDGRLLVLSGPTQEQKKITHGLHVAEPKPGGKLIELGTLGDVDGKAESVTVLDANGDVLRLLVMFDGPPNGGPREYRASLK
jgi:hypothetical protein